MYKTLAAILLVTTSPLGNPDLPQKGDKLIVIDMEPEVVIAVEPSTVRDEPDGSKSVVVLMLLKAPNKDGVAAYAGRVAVKCKAHSTRILSNYSLDGKGQIISNNGSEDKYDFAADGTVADLIVNGLCKQDPPNGVPTGINL